MLYFVWIANLQGRVTLETWLKFYQHESIEDPVDDSSLATQRRTSELRLSHLTGLIVVNLSPLQ